jgi:hypothetical protein
MVRTKNPTDPLTIFAAGKRGLATIYRALCSDNPAIQLAAARTLREAAARLPTAIENELTAFGDQHRRSRVLERGTTPDSESVTAL